MEENGLIKSENNIDSTTIYYFLKENVNILFIHKKMLKNSGNTSWKLVQTVEPTLYNERREEDIGRRRWEDLISGCQISPSFSIYSCYKTSLISPQLKTKSNIIIICNKLTRIFK